MSARRLALIGSILTAASVHANSGTTYFDLKRIGDGVYAAVRREPAGFAVDCNVAFIVNKQDVVVVDTNIGPESARATLAALRRITKKPVRYVVATHYHDDHIGGNAAFRKAYPGVEFIGHVTSREAMRIHAVPSRKQMIEIAPQMTKMLRTLIAQKRSYGGGPLTDEERTSYLSDIRIADRYARELRHEAMIPPTLAIDKKLTLYRGSRRIEIMSIGRGHTMSDLVVWLPKERIAMAGDLVVWPVPLVGSTQSYVTEWSATLDRLMALKPLVIVPGHGPLMRDDSYLRTLSKLYAAITQQVKDRLANGESLDRMQKEIDLQSFRKTLAGNSSLRRVLFDMYAAQPGIAAAYRELRKAKSNDLGTHPQP